MIDIRWGATLHILIIVPPEISFGAYPLTYRPHATHACRSPAAHVPLTFRSPAAHLPMCDAGGR